MRSWQTECPYLTEHLQEWSSSFGLTPNPLPQKQSFWDRPGIQLDRAAFETSLTSTFQQASYLDSGDWLFALPIVSCGLKLDDEAVRVADGLRLDLNLCVPHQCRCGAPVDASGLHSSVCKQAPAKLLDHALNDVVARAFSAAGIPVSTVQRASRSQSHRRKTSRRHDIHPMAGGQASCLGRDDRLYQCRLIT